MRDEPEERLRRRCLSPVSGIVAVEDTCRQLLRGTALQRCCRVLTKLVKGMSKIAAIVPFLSRLRAMDFCKNLGAVVLKQ